MSKIVAILFLVITVSSVFKAKKTQPTGECLHESYEYKYNPDNSELYTCNGCGLIGQLVGGEQIPNSYNRITGDYAYTDRHFEPLRFSMGALNE